MIIGITGTLAAGKGAVVQYLKDAGFLHFSMSGFIAEEVRRQGLEINRGSLVAVGNELRAKHGPGYIAEQLYQRASLTGKNCIIESIRTTGEINALRSKGEFYLFAVNARLETRYRRAISRNSEKDQITFEEFLQNERREMYSDDPNAQNLNACMRAADFHFENDRTIDDLNWQVGSALGEINQRTRKFPEESQPGRSLLSRDMILRHQERGNIFVHRFDLSNLRTTSYDVRLGSNFFQEQPFRSGARRIFNPFDADHIKRYWGEPQEMILAGEWMKESGPLRNIKPDDKIVVLGPGETILAHTEEFIGGRHCVTTEMRARSSMGRIGITVCKCAGWGDLGFCNRWTMEMSNHLKDTPVILVAGMRIAQIAFYQVDALSKSYSMEGGQYQVTDDTETMIRMWTPYSMLPRFSRENY